mmetsp:Transcript_5509/g.7576  ORF Transcript_5509/g.7576 Transcript_5509/m.7576 type:complete len:807 (-) Transcript_5509:445-2865(-)|eukprot:CAMPEP_0117761458 /NCGR_PEP_ID=MMETSP0947-20121206/17295_1 /TAXON_ID=44440 /ORGANISM="Chattonella subsalsa, Strain CCMP2191" /LENGTH=806 /DNA_ID=CAMNT_0005582459 /DNA_START=64 /DNA_END=2484 /DNA_ORIENTATION=-
MTKVMDKVFMLYCIALWISASFGEDAESGIEESEHSSESELEEMTPLIKFRVATSIFLIITILLILSSFFEFLKDMVGDMTPEKMRDVMDVLFSEMTVLGFLSLVTFCISKAGTLETVSELVFGQLDDGEDFLEELLESIHYDLFLVMVLFIIQTLAMIRLGAVSEKEWGSMEELIGKFDEMEKGKKRLAELYSKDPHGPKWYEFGKRKEVHKYFRLFEYASLKKEFIHGRQITHPFEEKPEHEHLPKTFNYGAYLTTRLSRFMADVIDMNVQTWLLMEFFLLFFYMVMFGSGSNPQVLMWVWVGLGYGIIFWMYQLKRGAKWMREMHINPEDMPCIGNSFKSNASTFHRRNSYSKAEDKPQEEPVAEDIPLPKRLFSPTGEGGFLNRFFGRDNKTQDGNYDSLTEDSESGRQSVSSHHDLKKRQPWRANSAHTFFDEKVKISETVDYDRLPGWCHLATHTHGVRGPVKRFFFGKAPNRQDMLYFFQCNGPESQKYAIRTLLFMHAVYFAVLVLEFYDDALEFYGLQGFFIYFSIGFAPTIAFFVVALPTIRDIVHMGCIGALRSQKDIAYVIREEKTKKALKSLILLKNLQNRLQKGMPSEGPPGEGPKDMSDLKGSTFVTSMENKRSIYEQTLKEITLSKEERMERLKKELGSQQFDEISKMFDLYDTDHGGEIDSSELQALMKSLGKVMNEYESEQMMKMLDIDGDGTVSKEEFIIWHVDQMNHPVDMDPETVARELFKTFDDDDSGSISVGEFKDVLDRFEVGLSVDEVSDLARELDVDGDGTISEEEFAALLMRHKDEVLG